MKPKPTQTREGKIFQWCVILLGGGVWLCYLWELGRLWRMEGATNGAEMVQMGALMVAVWLVSLKPVYLTTPGMTFSHKRQLSISLSDALSFLLLIKYGLAPAIVASGLDGLIASRRTVKRFESNLFSLAMFAISFWLAGHTFQQLLPAQVDKSYPVKALIMPLVLAASVHFLNASWLLSIILGLRYRTSIWRQWVDNQLWTAITYLTLPAVTLLVYFLSQTFGWLALATLGPTLALLYLSYSQYNQKVEEKMRKIEEMNELHLAVTQALTMAIDAKDNTSVEHVERVKLYGRGLAQILGLSELETQAIETGAMLHDIGKLGVPDYIVNKPGRLTDAEFEKMKSHTVIGAEILGQVKFPYPLVPVVRSHHERWDGTGYPDGLKGVEIPITARILAVVDCFDILREDRQHRKGMTREQAINILREEAGTHFDPHLVAAFLHHLSAFETEIIERGISVEQAQARRRALSTATSEATTAVQPREKIKEAHREILLLYELSQSIGSSLSLRDTLAVLLNRISDLVPFTTGAVLLKEHDREELYVAYAGGLDAEALRQQMTPVSNGISGWVFVNQTPAFNSDPLLDFDALEANVSRPYQTSMVLPLAQNGEVFGVLALYATQTAQYSSEHTRLAESIARLAGDAVANAVRHEQMEATALTDRLTGLPNLRALLARFDSEVSRAQRHTHSFTLLMMDLDGFKAINDTLGHQVGDRYLVEISKTINSQMREHDFFGRYAGDEFIAFLPQTEGHEAAALAERVRQAVSNFVLMTETGLTARAGVSIGVAEFGPHGRTLEELVAIADKGMYADKAAKPNRVPRANAAPNILKFPSKNSALPIQAVG